MIDWMSIVETDMMIHTVETDILKLMVEIKSFGMGFDEFDKESGSSDGLQPKQADLSYVNALNELHLHEIHVVPSKHEADQQKEAIHLILIGTKDEIYSTVDACKTAQEMWEAIERLQQDMDEEIEEQESDAHYSYMAKILKVPTAALGTNSEPLEQVQYNDEYNVFANVNQHCEQSESTSNTCLAKKDDSDVTPDSPDMCEHDIQTDQNAEDECDSLANLIAN
nr:hypothetical protein [Tanacetum cinerariifolium]